MQDGEDNVSNFCNFDIPSITVVNRAAKFESKFIANCNSMFLL